MKIFYLFIYFCLLTNESVLESITDTLVEYGLNKWLKAGWKTRPGRLISGTKSSRSQSPAVHPCTGTSRGHRRFSQRSTRGKVKSWCWRGKTPGTRYRPWPDKQESSFAMKHQRVLVNNKFLSSLHRWNLTWSAVLTPVSQSIKDRDLLEWVQQRVSKIKAVTHFSKEKRFKELWLCNLRGEGSGQGSSSVSVSTWWEGQKKRHCSLTGQQTMDIRWNIQNSILTPCFLPVKVVKYWNKLPTEAVESPPVEIFKIWHDMVLGNLLW